MCFLPRGKYYHERRNNKLTIFVVLYKMKKKKKIETVDRLYNPTFTMVGDSIRQSPP